MCYEKNATAIIHVYAYDSLGDAVTGDAANITATWSLDGDTTPNATNDVNPTELGTTGCYIFNMTAAEMNGDQATLFPVSSTADVYLDIVQVVMQDNSLLATSAEVQTAHATTDDLIGNISVGSAAISIVAGSFVKSGAEPETNTYTSTQQLDGVDHIVEDVATATDAYYQFDVGPNGVPVQLEWTGYAQGNNATYNIYAYNYGTTSYEQLGTVTGTAGTTVQSKSFSTTVSHVGTGANNGLVRFRFQSADGTAFATDRLLCNYSVLDTALGYEDGAVWIDETAGTSTGTTPGVDGLITNRSDDFDNAQTIAAALGYTKLSVTNGNSITLAATINDFTIGILGGSWSLNAGSQDVTNCDFNDAVVSGVATGTNAHFRRCIFGTSTIPPSSLYNCGVGNGGGTLTFGSAGAFRLIECYSDVAGSGSPTIDMGVAVGATTLELRDWKGGLTLNNLAAGDVVTIGGSELGTITLNGADAEVEIRGIAKAVVNNLTGTPSVTVSGIEGNVSTVVNAIEVDTQDLQAQIGTAGSGLSAIPIPSWASTITEFWHHPTTSIVTASTVGKLLVDNVDDTISSRASSTALATAQSDLDVITDVDGIVVGPTATAAITVSVWDDLMSAHITSGTFGRAVRELYTIVDDPDVGLLDPFQTFMKNGVWDALTADHTIVGSTGEAIVSGGITVADIWNALTATYTAPGSMGQALGSAGVAADPLLAVVPGAYAAGTAGNYLGLIGADWDDGGRLDLILDSIDTTMSNILGLGVIQLVQPLDPDTNLLTIIRDGTYDGIAFPLLSWTTTKDFTGWTGTFTIRHRDTDVILAQKSVTVASPTELTVQLDAADTQFQSLLYERDFGKHWYDIQMTIGVSNQVLGPYVVKIIQDIT